MLLPELFYTPIDKSSRNVERYTIYSFTSADTAEAQLADNKKRPSFQIVQNPGTFKSPEELFGKLTGRATTHAYLRRRYCQVNEKLADRPPKILGFIPS